MSTPNVRSTLKAIIAEQGIGILAEPRRVEGLLLDLCPGQKRENHLLAGAQHAGVPDDLRSSSTVPPPLLRARLQQRLSEDLSVTEEAARWAVETWAIALGLLAESEALSGPSLRDSQRGTQPAPEQPVLTSPPQNALPQNAPPVWPPPVAGGWQVGTNDSGTGVTAVLPPQLRGFNWGALWLNWIWAVGNQTWIGLLALIPYAGFVMAIVLGVKGNEWAWQNRRWDSVEQFQAQQKTWAVVGWVLTGISVVIVIVALIAGAGDKTS